MKRVLIPALAVAALAACTTPPIDTPKATGSVTLSELTGLPRETAGPAMVPAVPAFNINAPEGLAIPVPDNARQVTLSTATLHIKLTNRMAIPLQFRLALSKTDRPYEDASASLTPEPLLIAEGESKQIDRPVDPTLFKQPKVYMGVTLSTPGNFPKIVTVRGTDAIDVESWVTVQVKLL
ncbi:lipoprotein [bacterium]|nr:lipoprotein [bacterium]